MLSVFRQPLLMKRFSNDCMNVFGKTQWRGIRSMSDDKKAMVTYDIDQYDFATITLDRPEMHNAFSDIVIGEIDKAIDKVMCNDNIRGLFLAANGKSFSAGGDLNWMQKASKYSQEENINDAMALSKMLNKLSKLPVPTIALVQGPAFGGGVGLISVCDMAIGVSSSFFMLSEVKLGLIPATISPYVVNRIGANNCRRYFLTAERIPSSKAYQIGLLNEVVESVEQLTAFKSKLIETIRLNSPTGIKESKLLIDAVKNKPIDEAVMRDTAVRLAKQRDSVEGKEGLAAFFEKRKPSWAIS